MLHLSIYIYIIVLNIIHYKLIMCMCQNGGMGEQEEQRYVTLIRRVY